MPVLRKVSQIRWGEILMKPFEILTLHISPKLKMIVYSLSDNYVFMTVKYKGVLQYTSGAFSMEDMQELLYLEAIAV